MILNRILEKIIVVSALLKNILMVNLCGNMLMMKQVLRTLSTGALAALYARTVINRSNIEGCSSNLMLGICAIIVLPFHGNGLPVLGKIPAVHLADLVSQPAGNAGYIGADGLSVI